MAYKGYALNVSIRIFLILVTLTGSAISILLLKSDQLLFTYLLILLILIAQVIELIRYVRRTNMELANFLKGIKSKDFQMHYRPEGESGSKKELYQAFNEIVGVMNEISLEKRAQYLFLKRLVGQIEIGILILDPLLNIELINDMAEDLLDISGPSKWQHIHKKAPEFSEAVKQILPEGRILLESGRDKQMTDLAIQVASIKLLDDQYTIIVFQNISSEVDQKVNEAWIKLIRTMNHEIMNSVTPISSLTETILMILRNDNNEYKSPGELNKEQIADVIGSVDTIRKRGQNLLAFVNEYRKLTKIPKPKIENIQLQDFMEELHHLMKAEFDRNNIHFELNIDPVDLCVSADPVLLQQVLLNLIKNSIEALGETKGKEISVCAGTDINLKPNIEVRDNGPGIVKGLQKEVFVPFFSTKDGGSGIGLNLCRQIMHLHGGSINVSSEPGQMTTFMLNF